MSVPGAVDPRGPVAARAALANPAIEPSELALIAQLHPGLRAEIAMHPSAYPELLDWLDALGDPVLSAVVNVRRQAARANSPAGTPTVTSQRFEAQGTTGAGLPGATKPRQRRTRLLIGLGSLALAVVLVVTGIATRGFGLLPAGGSATPQEEAVKVASKTVELFNSLSARSLLSNPLAAMGSFTDEIAPSEAKLSARPALGSGQSNTTIDTTDLLGLTGETLGTITEIAGSFRVQAINVRADVTQITDDIAAVTYVEGTVTVTADTDKLRAALMKMPSVADQQFAATAQKYGLHPNALAVEDQLPDGWLDDAIDEVESRFPVTIDLADYEQGRDGSAELPNLGIGNYYRQLSAVVVVKEGGRWYLSPMLTGYFWSNGVAAVLKDFRPDSDDKRLLDVEPARNSSPVEAAEGLAKAIGSGRERSVLAELPLAERRYAAFSGIGPFPGLLSQLPASESSERPTVKFSEIAKNGDQAKVRIDEFSPVFASGGNTVAIEDGTCLSTGGQSHCLSDYLDSRTVTDALDSLRNAPWGSFEDTTGIDPDELVDKLEAASEKAIETVNPDQIGLVAIQENGSWFVSASATLGDLQNQAMGALVAGLKAAQNR